MDDIWKELKRMQDTMDHMFAEIHRDQDLLEAPKSKSMALTNYKKPASDIYETDKEIVAEIDMPGVDKKDIKVNVTQDGIEVRGQTKSETKDEDKKKGMYRFERNYSGYYRYYSLPKNADAEKAACEYKNGVLKIAVPKLMVESKKRKEIEVK